MLLSCCQVAVQLRLLGAAVIPCPSAHAAPCCSAAHHSIPMAGPSLALQAIATCMSQWRNRRKAACEQALAFSFCSLACAV